MPQVYDSALTCTEIKLPSRGRKINPKENHSYSIPPFSSKVKAALPICMLAARG